jgi:hypothetical protein
MDAKPKRIPARKYAPPQAQFLAAKMADMERLGLVKKKLSSRWESPPLILPKAGPEKFRFTLDLRYPNSQAKQVSWLMPNMEDGVGISGGVKLLRHTGSYVRILAAPSTSGLSRVPVYHHSRWSVHAA